MINVVGLGYIGLPTALILASSGIKVWGTDIQTTLIDNLNEGKMNFDEAGLKGLFRDAIETGIQFSTEIKETDFYIITVPTPYEERSKKIDISYLLSAVDSILDVCLDNAIIVIESTISPGTIQKFIKPYVARRGVVIGENIHIVHAPERIIPGNMIYELKNNSRTIGADNPVIGKKVKEVYETFCNGEVILTDTKSAEMSKVIENTYRDINIAFANEIAKICREDEMDVYEIIRIANNHPRVNILQPGPGVGGHCISVDPWFLVGDYPDITNLILTARKVNDSMPEHVLTRIGDIMKKNGIETNERVGLYGLAYKENVNDIRESPTLQLISKMKKYLAEPMKVYDPYINEKVVDNQVFDFEEFIDNLDLIVIMVAHDHIVDNMSSLDSKYVLDTKNICKNSSVYKL